MLPLRIAFLWHQHQPDYMVNGRFFLPWVRMHAAKDYSDLLHILSDYDFPHTINVVPTLLTQLTAYGRGVTDRVQELYAIPSQQFDVTIMNELIGWVKTLQYKTMVSPFPNLDRIWKESVESVEYTNRNDVQERAVNNLKGLLALAWIGPVSRRSHSNRSNAQLENHADPTNKDYHRFLFEHYDLNENDVELLVEHHLALCASFVDTLLAKSHHFEVSITPFNHPILPLLINTDVANLANPNTFGPNLAVRLPGAAAIQVASAIEYWKGLSGVSTVGMWSAEGSISAESVALLAQHNVVWTASDEAVLAKSTSGEFDPTAKYFPHLYSTPSGDIHLFFRDHALSDAIGFEYSSWDPDSAAKDFIRRLESIRSMLVQHHGEQVLSDAIVPIILDGENCWEFYPNNGEDFLRALMSLLQESESFIGIKLQDACKTDNPRILHELKPGSWIGGDFNVWIGTEAKNRAWTLLGEAHVAVETHSAKLLADSKLDAVRAILSQLEASDWFWWYHPQHKATHKDVFDQVYRSLLADVFKACNVVPSISISRPLTEDAEPHIPGLYPLVFSTGAMHQANSICRAIQLETNNDWQRITCWLERELADDETVQLLCKDADGNERSVYLGASESMFNSTVDHEGFEWRSKLQAAVYLRTSQRWTVEVTEQRSGGTRAVDVVQILTPTQQ